MDVKTGDLANNPLSVTQAAMTSVQRNVVDVLPNNLGDSKESLTHVDAREISVPAVYEVTGYLILDFLWRLPDLRRSLHYSDGKCVVISDNYIVKSF